MDLLEVLTTQTDIFWQIPNWVNSMSQEVAILKLVSTDFLNLYTISLATIISILLISDAAFHKCSLEKVLCMYVINLQDNTHVEVWFQIKIKLNVLLIALLKMNGMLTSEQIIAVDAGDKPQGQSIRASSK